MQPSPQQLQQAVDHAIRLHQAGRVDEAERIYRQVLQHDPNQPDALHLLGLIAHHAGVRQQAVELMSRAIAVAPNVALYRVNLAKVFRALGRWSDATASARRAVELQPTFVEALVELSACLRSENKPAEAHEVARRAVAIRQDHPDAHNALANALSDLDQPEPAIEHYRLALKLRPDWGEALSNLGETLRKLGRFDEAEAHLRRAIALVDDAEPHFNLSLILLAEGRFEEGWREYEYRWRQIGAALPPLPRPLWDGSDLAGRTILLHSEQGLGDSIQFIRYALMLREERSAGCVIVTCEKPLVPLMQTVVGVDAVVEKGSPLPPFDVHCPLASLPLRFGTTLQTIPIRVPYVSSDPGRARRWREELELSTSARNIGLVWAGSSAHKNDRHRSCHLSDLAPLAGVPGIRWISLQLGPARHQLADPPPGLNVTDAAGGIKHFGDTAALLSQLDLLISVDTAPAHLAGALGRPVWTIHPFVADFRWLLHRVDSPWYPTMRLFRQPRAGDWDSVMRQVTEALKKAPAR